MSKPLLFAAVLTAAALPFAAPAAFAQGAADTNPAHAKAGVYAIEPTHTRVMFSLSHLGFTTWYGEFTGASGQLTLDPAHPSESRLDVTIPIANVTTTNAKLDGELRGPAWLDAEKYPVASFHSTSITPTGAGEADVAGALTLHGVTRPLVLHAHFNGAGVNFISHAYTTGFEVSGTIQRSDFGVKAYVPAVGDATRLIISAAFEKAKG